MLRPKRLKLDLCLERSARFGAGLGDLEVVGDGVDLPSDSVDSTWRLDSAESRSKGDGIASFGPVGVSGG